LGIGHPDRLQIRVKEIFELAFGQRANLGRCDFAVLEQQQRVGIPRMPYLGAVAWVLVNIQLGDGQLAFELSRQFHPE
jgi:hypothetical protein